MADDRRTSVRRRARLPFSWRESRQDATRADLCDALAVPRAVGFQSRLADLDDELLRVTSHLTDAYVADALRILDGKVAVLEEAVLASLPRPPVRAIEISADGIGFGADQLVPHGTWLAVLLVLPEAYHIVSLARVSHCMRAVGGASEPYHIGAEFHGLDASAARRLTRYAIAREQDLA